MHGNNYTPDNMCPNMHKVSGTIEHIGRLESKNLGSTRVFHKIIARVCVPEADFDTTRKRTTVEFQFINKYTNLLNGLLKGDTVTIWFTVRGNVHNDRIYTNLIAQNIEVIEKGGSHDN